MKNYRKILFVFFLTIFLLFISINLSFAAERELEVPIPGLETTKLPALPDYIVAIYNFSLMAIGIICFLALLYGGFRYLTSTGKPAAMADAKDQIFSALLGLLILLASYLILTTINPELVILSETAKKPIGVTPRVEITLYENLNYQPPEYTISESIANLADIGWDNRISSIKFPFGGMEIKVYKEPNYGGNECILYQSADDIGVACGSSDWDNEISSIKFVQISFPSALMGNAEIGTYPHGDFYCPTDGGESTLENVSPEWTTSDTRVFLNVHERPHGSSLNFGNARFWTNDAYVRADDNTLRTRIGCAGHNSALFGNLQTHVDYLLTKGIKSPNIETGTYVHEGFACSTNGGESIVHIDPRWVSPDTKVFVNVHEMPHGSSVGFGDARLWVNDAYIKGDDNTLRTRIGCACLTCLFPITVNVDYLLIKGVIGTGTYVHEGFACPTHGGESIVHIDPRWVSPDTKVFVNVHERPHGSSLDFGNARLWVNDAYIKGDDNTLRTRIGCGDFFGNISVYVDYFLIKEASFY